MTKYNINAVQLHLASKNQTLSFSLTDSNPTLATGPPVAEPPCQSRVVKSSRLGLDGRIFTGAKVTISIKFKPIKTCIRRDRHEALLHGQQKYRKKIFMF